MSAEGDVLRALASLEGLTEQAFGVVMVRVENSIKFGDPVTGAPGQPVDKGDLLRSYLTEYVTPLHASTTSPLPYAEPIDDGIGPHGPLTLRSEQGGFGSVKQTAANLQALVDDAVSVLIPATQQPRGEGQP